MEKVKLNLNGEKHGWGIIYNAAGEEIEKIFYDNGIKMGNPFDGKTAYEVVEMLGGEIEDDYKDEEGEEIKLDNKNASTLLIGETYYGK